MNSTTTQVLVRDTFSIALAKNLILAGIWLTMSYINVCVVATFYSNQIFYEDPRYILFIHMVINDAVQLTVTVTLVFLSYIFYNINVSVCCMFMFVAALTTRNTPLNLAGMAIERYIAICKPLRYGQMCTVYRTYILIGLIWLLCAVTGISDLVVTLATEPISFFHSSVLCIHQNVFRGPAVLYQKQAFDALYFSLVFLTLVYTYHKIVHVARAACTDKTSAQRARKTIILHGIQLLMCMLSYISPSLDNIFTGLFPIQIVAIRYANYIIVYILPRCLSPIVYGLQDKKFFSYLKRYFICVQCKVSKREGHQGETNGAS